MDDDRQLLPSCDEDSNTMLFLKTLWRSMTMAAGLEIIATS